MAETHEFDVVGVITSEDSLAVSVQSEGAVMELKVHDGLFVRKGELIARLNTEVLQSQLAKATGDKERAAGDAARAGAEAANAERKARMAVRLASVGVGSPADVQNARLEAESAGGGGAGAVGAMKAAESQIKETERLIKAADLTAPMDGIVSAIKFHEGEVPHAGQALARVFNPNKLQIKFQLPRGKHSAVKLGDHVELTYGEHGDHKVGAIVNEVTDPADVAIDFYIVTANVDKTQARPDDLQVGVRGTVHLADKGVAR
jgi:RND family efflux transporter MFP subunit